MSKNEGSVTQGEEGAFQFEPIAAISGVATEASNEVLKLQLAMATSSINHEYARLELDEVRDQDREEEIMEYMNQCREKYFEARESLKEYDPHALLEFEKDLMQQKLETLARYTA